MMTLGGGVLRMTTPSCMAACNLNTVPHNCVRENSLQLSGYGVGLSIRQPLFESRQDHIFLPCIYSFLSLLRTLFVRTPFHLSGHKKEITKTSKKYKKDQSYLATFYRLLSFCCLAATITLTDHTINAATITSTDQTMNTMYLALLIHSKM